MVKALHRLRKRNAILREENRWLRAENRRAVNAMKSAIADKLFYSFALSPPGDGIAIDPSVREAYDAYKAGSKRTRADS